MEGSNKHTLYSQDILVNKIYFGRLHHHFVSTVSPAALVPTVNDAGDGDTESPLPSVAATPLRDGASVADSGSGVFDGDGDRAASPRSGPADGGSGIWDGERGEVPGCTTVSAWGDVSFRGSNVHSQCRLRRFRRSSNAGFRRFWIVPASPTQSLMAAAWI